MFLFFKGNRNSVKNFKSGANDMILIVTGSHDGHVWSETIAIKGLNFAAHYADRFSDGRLVLAYERTSRRSSTDFELNGVIYDPQSSQTTYFLAGDGIASLAIDAKDQIWISYYDEGVFGNYGWSFGQQSPVNPGSGGLSCFDAEGQLLWRFNQDGPGGIDDCYALNVSDKNIWAYYYSDFNLASIDAKFTVAEMKIELAGSHAFAINRKMVVFAGGYHDKPDMFYHANRQPNSIGPLRKIRLSVADGKVSDSDRIIGRGSILHCFTNKNWFAFDLNNQHIE